MRILRRYVSGSFCSAFLLAEIVLTFVLSAGLVVKATQLLVRGLPPGAVLGIVLMGMPESLAITIPLAALVSALLVFGRLSADGEISAMKACGVNLWSVMSTPLLASALLSVLCLYLNNMVSPHAHARRRTISSTVGLGMGLKLLEPGRFIQEFPNMTFWFARRDGDWLEDVLIFDKSRTGKNREIRAERARVEVQGQDLLLDLYRVRVDPFNDDTPGAASADRLVHVIPGALRIRTYHRDAEDYDLGEMTAHLATLCRADQPGVTPAESRVLLHKALAELNRRLAMASAPLCFVLVGMPLGIRAQRRESTSGVAISLGVALLYYIFVMLADSFTQRSGHWPLLLAWAPAAICLGLSAWLVARNQ